MTVPSLGADEFDTLLRRLGPWPADRGVAVAVSGGADSLALAILLRGWCTAASPLAIVVDHGLRPESGPEAVQTLETLARLSISSRLLTLSLPPGTSLQERARRARHAALAAACAEAGLLDLLLAHHRADQDETRRMRAASGSGPEGLAGMSELSERNGIRLVRPLLGIDPARLRATLREAGVSWIEDPSNHDLRFERARLRARPGRASEPSQLSADTEAADWLARNVEIHEAGYARLPASPMPPAALSRLLRVLSGHEHPPRRASVERLARIPRPATLHGVRLVQARGGLIVCREPAAASPPVAARRGALWDGRFRLATGPDRPGWTLGALGRPASRPRAGLPAAVLPTLPALRDGDGNLRAIPHLGWPEYVHEFDVIFAPALPIAPSFFIDGVQAVTEPASACRA